MQIAVVTAFAQKVTTSDVQRPEPVNPMKDVQEYQGYTIRLLPVFPAPPNIAGFTYGFDILQNNKPVVHLVKNPLASSPKGIQKKEDAYKIAQWMIQEHAKTGHWESQITPDITKELKIETN